MINDGLIIVYRKNPGTGRVKTRTNTSVSTPIGIKSKNPDFYELCINLRRLPNFPKVTGNEYRSEIDRRPYKVDRPFLNLMEEV